MGTYDDQTGSSWYIDATNNAGTATALIKADADDTLWCTVTASASNWADTPVAVWEVGAPADADFRAEAEKNAIVAGIQPVRMNLRG